MLFFYDHLKERAEKLITEGKINANTAFKFCWKQIYRLKQKNKKKQRKSNNSYKQSKHTHSALKTLTFDPWPLLFSEVVNNQDWRAYKITRKNNQNKKTATCVAGVSNTRDYCLCQRENACTFCDVEHAVLI